MTGYLIIKEFFDAVFCVFDIVGYLSRAGKNLEQMCFRPMCRSITVEMKKN